MSRISSTLNIQIKQPNEFGKPMHLIVDSTGLSVHGEAIWLEHKHGKKQRRGWRKLHILITRMDLFKQISERLRKQMTVVKCQSYTKQYLDESVELGVKGIDKWKRLLNRYLVLDPKKLELY